MTGYQGVVGGSRLVEEMVGRWLLWKACLVGQGPGRLTIPSSEILFARAVLEEMFCLEGDELLTGVGFDNKTGTGSGQIKGI